MNKKDYIRQLLEVYERQLKGKKGYLFHTDVLRIGKLFFKLKELPVSELRKLWIAEGKPNLPSKHLP